MIKISKDEMQYMSTKGFKFGSDLHKSYTRYPHYWLTTSPKAMNVLNKYRKSRITN